MAQPQPSPDPEPQEPKDATEATFFKHAGIETFAQLKERLGLKKCQPADLQKKT